MTDQNSTWTKKSTDIPAHPYGDDLEAVLIDQDTLHSRIRELAAAVDERYCDIPEDLILVCVLKGAVFFITDFARELEIPNQLEFMAVSSYGNSTSSSGVVRILKDLDRDIEGRDVLIVEDIIDSGLTLKWLLANLRSRGPKSVEIATLLRKPEAARVEIDVKYVGFDIPNEFVIGYGLDHAENYRNLPYVGVLARSVYED